jgi:hypothetical protein
MTGDKCLGVGNNKSVSSMYTTVQSLNGGAIQMGLYSDTQCVVFNIQTNYSYNIFVKSGVIVRLQLLYQLHRHGRDIKVYHFDQLQEQ